MKRLLSLVLSAALLLSAAGCGSSEAPGFGMPVLYYDRASRGAACYLELADELMKNRR